MSPCSKALMVFCALVSAAGKAAFRKLSQDQLAQLLKDVAKQSGIEGERPPSTPGEAAELFCALARLGSGEPELLSQLCRLLCGSVAELQPGALTTLARALGRGDPHEEFVLLHAVCQQVLRTGFQSASDAASLLLICSKWEFYDELVFTLAARSLQDGVGQIPLSQLCDVVYAVGSLPTRDALPLESLDAVCDDLARRAHGLSEADLVRLARGLLKLRHQHETLLAALGPVVAEQQAKIQSVSLCNLINVFSYFGGLPNGSQKQLLETAVSRARRLQPISVQHILTALCRLRQTSELFPPLQRLCQHVASNATHSGAPAFTPVQALSSLSAMAKLQERDLSVLSVLTVSLGVSASFWTWAPSTQFFRWRPVPRLPCLGKCRSILEARPVADWGAPLFGHSYQKHSPLLNLVWNMQPILGLWGAYCKRQLHCRGFTCCRLSGAQSFAPWQDFFVAASVLCGPLWAFRGADDPTTLLRSSGPMGRTFIPRRRSLLRPVPGIQQSMTNLHYSLSFALE